MQYPGTCVPPHTDCVTQRMCSTTPTTCWFGLHTTPMSEIPLVIDCSAYRLLSKKKHFRQIPFDTPCVPRTFCTKSWLHVLRGCVSDNVYSPESLILVQRAAFSQVRNDTGKDCRHTNLCGPSSETMAFLDRARDANIATAIPRLKLKHCSNTI